MAAICFSHQITLTACQVAGRMTRDLRGKTEAHHSTHLQLVKSHSDERVVALSAVASDGSGVSGIRVSAATSNPPLRLVLLWCRLGDVDSRHDASVGTPLAQNHSDFWRSRFFDAALNLRCGFDSQPAHH